MRARVVRADVHALDAPARIPLVLVLRGPQRAPRPRAAGYPLDQRGVDAASPLDAVARQVNLLGAGGHRKARRPRDAGQSPREAVLLLRRAAAQLLLPHPADGAVIHIQKADDHFLRASAQRIHQASEPLRMPRLGVRVAQKDGVVAPYHPLGARGLRKPPERVCHRALAAHARLHVPAVRREGELEVVGEPALVQLAQPSEHRRGILRPEHDGVHCLGVKPPLRHLVRVERVARDHEPLPHPLEEPLRVERRDVGAPARADDHSRPPLARRETTRYERNASFTGRRYASAMPRKPSSGIEKGGSPPLIARTLA